MPDLFVSPPLLGLKKALSAKVGKEMNFYKYIGGNMATRRAIQAGLCLLVTLATVGCLPSEGNLAGVNSSSPVETRMIEEITAAPTNTTIPIVVLTPPPSFVTIAKGVGRVTADIDYVTLERETIVSIIDEARATSAWFRSSKGVEIPTATSLGPPVPVGSQNILTGHWYNRPVWICDEKTKGECVKGHYWYHEGSDHRPKVIATGQKQFWVASPCEAVILRVGNAPLGGCRWTGDASTENFCWWSSGIIVVIATKWQNKVTYYIAAHMVDPEDPTTQWPEARTLGIGTPYEESVRVYGANHTFSRQAASWNFEGHNGWPSPGTLLSPGQIFWILGDSGNTEGAHIHWVVAVEQQDGSLVLVNPEDYGLRRNGVRQ